MSTRFLIVDDHPLFVEALQLVIRTAFPDAVVSEASSIESARTAIEKDRRLDLLLLDLSLPETCGLDGLLELRTRYPQLPIVIISALEDPRIIDEVIRFGAAGFISKATRGPELANAVREVLSGSVVLPKGYRLPKERSHSIEASDLSARLATLTPQQIRVLQMLRQGKLNKQIAHKLGVRTPTVKAHVTEILRKLKVTSRTQAVIEVARIDFESILAEAPAGDTDPLRASR